ncbi:MAG TPA: universal stress protein [Chloroflexota bacterium]
MEPVHLTLEGAIIALAFSSAIIAVIVWMLRLPEQTPTTVQVAKAVRMTQHTNLILVPVQGSALSDRMVALGAQMAKARRAQLVVFCVVEVPWMLPLDAHLPDAEQVADETLARARRITDRYGVPLTRRIAHARAAGHAIIDEAVEAGADIILMGDLPGRAGETRFSETTNYVFTHAPCEVVIDRPAAGDLGQTPRPRRELEAAGVGR